jgi:hypothetical protein
MNEASFFNARMIEIYRMSLPRGAARVFWSRPFVQYLEFLSLSRWFKKKNGADLYKRKRARADLNRRKMIQTVKKERK